MNTETTYLTVSEAAEWIGCTDRTIRRWMSGRLLAVYRRADGALVLELAELTRVQRDQKRKRQNPRARVRREYMQAIEDLASAVSRAA